MRFVVRAALTVAAFVVAIPMGIPVHEYLHCVRGWAAGSPNECEVTFAHPGEVGVGDEIATADTGDDEKGLVGGGLTASHVAIYAVAQLALPIVAALTVWHATDG